MKPGLTFLPFVAVVWGLFCFVFSVGVVLLCLFFGLFVFLLPAEQFAAPQQRAGSPTAAGLGWAGARGSRTCPRTRRPLTVPERRGAAAPGRWLEGGGGSFAPRPR